TTRMERPMRSREWGSSSRSISAWIEPGCDNEGLIALDLLPYSVDSRRGEFREPNPPESQLSHVPHLILPRSSRDSTAALGYLLETTMPVGLRLPARNCSQLKERKPPRRSERLPRGLRPGME